MGWVGYNDLKAVTTMRLLGSTSDYTFSRKSRTRWHKQRERYDGEQRNLAALVEGPRSSR